MYFKGYGKEDHVTQDGPTDKTTKDKKIREDI